ncbi:MAG: DedA family protein [Acidobacteria bacterium]|nr:DedA family protein [Acidobacteriota bacterium]
MEPASLFNIIVEQFPFLSTHKYILLFIAGSLEGFTAMILAGFLLAVGKLNFWPTFIVLSAAEMVNGFVWYAVGYWGGFKPVDWITRKSARQGDIVKRVRGFLERYTGQAILLAKMTFSITIVTQILTGAIRYPFRKFTLFNFIGSVGWVLLVLMVGYFFGESYKAFFQYWRNFGHLVVYFGLGLAALYLLRRLLRNILFQTLSLTERFQWLGKKLGQGLEKIVSNGPRDDVHK